MRTTLLLTGSILVLTPCFSQEPGQQPDATAGTIKKLTPHFRKAFWGDSMNEVLKKETAELIGSDEDLLAFETKVADVPVWVYFAFEDDKLVPAQYLGKQDYYQAESYIKDFEEFKRLLTAK